MVGQDLLLFLADLAVSMREGSLGEKAQLCASASVPSVPLVRE